REAPMDFMSSQVERLERLERLVRITKWFVILGCVLGVSFFVFERYVLASAPENKILRVRGIVIEDSNGRPRLLLGAPISNQGRKRKDEVTGLVMLSENGTDRLALGTANY